MARSCSLNIGINRTGGSAPGTTERGTLQYCRTDAHCMADLAKANGYDSTVILLDETATVDRVITEVRRAARLVDNGVFLWTFSGHGTIVPALKHDKVEGKYDEGWVLCDGILLDNWIHALLAEFNEDASVILISDCCYGGDMGRVLDLLSESPDTFPPHISSEEPPRGKSLDEKTIEAMNLQPGCSGLLLNDEELEPRIRAEVVSIGACEATEIALDGVFTPTLANLISPAYNTVMTHRWTLKEAIAKATKLLPPTQRPTYKTYGRENMRLLSARPFSIPQPSPDNHLTPQPTSQA